MFFPGEFEDAFVYMGKIAAITLKRTIAFIDLEKVVANLDERQSSSVPVGHIAFLRNNDVSTSIFKDMMRNPDVADAVLAAFDSFPTPFFEVNPFPYQLNEIELNLSASLILDTNIYNSRIYWGTEKGLFHGDFDWGRDEVALVKGFTKRSDAKCISTSVGYGAVNASCGDQGLLSGFDEFGLARLEKSNGLERVAEKSIRSAWFSFDVVNYTSSSQMTLLKTRRQRTDRTARASERTSHVLTGITQESMDLKFLFDHIYTEYGVERDSVQYVYNSTNTIFIHCLDGNFYSVGISPKKLEEGRVRFTKTYKGQGTRILSVHSTETGLIIETDNRVFLFAHGRWWPLMESAVLSIRTFPRSKSFRNLVALTTEEGLHLVGLFDDDGYLSGVET